MRVELLLGAKETYLTFYCDVVVTGVDDVWSQWVPTPRAYGGGCRCPIRDPSTAFGLFQGKTKRGHEFLFTGPHTHARTQSPRKASLSAARRCHDCRVNDRGESVPQRCDDGPVCVWARRLLGAGGWVATERTPCVQGVNSDGGGTHDGDGKRSHDCHGRQHRATQPAEKVGWKAGWKAVGRKRLAWTLWHHPLCLGSFARPHAHLRLTHALNEKQRRRLPPHRPRPPPPHRATMARRC